MSHFSFSDVESESLIVSDEFDEETDHTPAVAFSGGTDRQPQEEAVEEGAEEIPSKGTEDECAPQTDLIDMSPGE